MVREMYAGLHRLTTTECSYTRPRKNIGCFLQRPEKEWIGKSVKIIILDYFLGQICVFHACFTLIWCWDGGKNFRVGISLNKNLLGYSYRNTGNKELCLGLWSTLST